MSRLKDKLNMESYFDKTYFETDDFKKYIIKNLKNELSNKISDMIFDVGNEYAFKFDGEKIEEDIERYLIRERFSVNVEEIVRCKDCAMYERAFEDDKFCSCLHMEMPEYGFCSYGERKKCDGITNL